MKLRRLTARLLLITLGDVDHYTRVRTYKAFAANYYEPDRV
jgi:ATP sulfurylase